jgi:hypothetical protein
MTIIIENSDILQACVTVLIGVLIFLTLERRFEKKDLTSYYLELKLQKYRVRQKIDSFAKEMKGIEAELEKEIDPEDKMKLQAKYNSISKRRTDADNEEANLDDNLLKIESYDKKDASLASRHQKMKDREDVVNSIAVTLLSACIIFMILVSADWKFDRLDYSSLSRILFAAGIGALVCRVFLYTLDMKLTKFEGRPN